MMWSQGRPDGKSKNAIDQAEREIANRFDFSQTPKLPLLRKATRSKSSRMMHFHLEMVLISCVATCQTKRLSESAGVWED